MHVATKEVDEKGTHILTSVLEADGASSLASPDAKLSATVISVQRTESGGVRVQTALTITEPAPKPMLVTTDRDVAIAFFTAKGFPKATAEAQVEKFGVARVLEAAAKEKADAEKGLDAELQDVLSSNKSKSAK